MKVFLPLPISLYFPTKQRYKNNLYVQVEMNLFYKGKSDI